MQTLSLLTKRARGPRPFVVHGRRLEISSSPSTQARGSFRSCSGRTQTRRVIDPMVTLHRSTTAPTRLRTPARRSWGGSFAVVGVLGALAFVFSAVSPEDDDFQQEFAQSTKTRQCLVRNLQSISNVYAGGSKSVHDAGILRSLTTVDRSFVRHVIPPAAGIGAIVLSTRTVGRSPPS